MKEKDLIDKFIELNSKLGLFLREVPVGFKSILKPEARDKRDALAWAYPYTKKIDLVLFKEGKEKLRNYRLREYENLPYFLKFDLDEALLNEFNFLQNTPLDLERWLELKEILIGSTV